MDGTLTSDSDSGELNATVIQNVPELESKEAEEHSTVIENIPELESKEAKEPVTE